MAEVVLNKRAQNAIRTRDKLVDAAVELYGNSSIDGVSLREIAVAAGQKNPNALQYHFRDRDGLLQAIVDKHASRIGEKRNGYIERARKKEWPVAEAAARVLVMPIIEYVETKPEGVNFVKVVSQIAAVHQSGADADVERGIRFPRARGLVDVFNAALSTLPPREAQQRIYLVVTTTFHTIADIYRVSAQLPASSPIAGRERMIEQLILLVTTYFSAPSLAT